MEQEMFEKVLGKIDRDEVIRLAMQLVDIPSPTGEEGEVAEFILNWFKESGFESVRQEVELGRLNAVGVLRGSGRGLSLMFNSHLDTTHPGTPEDLETIGAGIASLRPKACLEDDIIYGLGIHNDKGPLAAAMIALKALKDGGANLSGDVIVAAVCGEIGMAPVGKYQGLAYHGHGYGTRYLLAHGVVPDLALVAEPSGYQAVWTLPGVLFMKVTTYGESVYIPFINRAGWEKEKKNCIKNTIEVLEVIEDWAIKYEEHNNYASPGGTVTGRVNIGAIEAGLPYRPIYSLGSCSIFVDVRVLPSRKLMDVKRELEDVLEKTGVKTKVEVYRSQRGYEGSNNDQLVDAIRASYEQVFDTELPQASIQQASMWNDVNIFHEMGIPAVKFGTPPATKRALSAERTESGGEGVRVDDLVKIASIYALIAIRICAPGKS